MADNVGLVREAYEAFARGDIQRVLGLLDDKVEWYEAEHVTYWPGGSFVGPQAVLNGVFARIPQDFDGFRVDVGRIVGCGDTVLVEARYRGTVKARSAALNTKDTTPWAATVRRICLLVTPTSETCEVMPMTKEK